MRRYLYLLLICFILSGGVLYLGVEAVLHHPDARANLRVLDRHGQVLAQADNAKFGRRNYVPLEKISPSLIQAVLQQEDRYFFAHHGIDPRALGRALWVNGRSGSWLQGGSTITQQWAKVLWENYRGKRNPRTLPHKLMESLIALSSEWHYDKNQILEAYLNSVYLGHRLYGVEAAAQAYFGKSAQDLTQSESLSLAARIRRPNRGEQTPVFSPNPASAPHLLSLFSQIPTPRIGDRVALSTLDVATQNLAQRALDQGLLNLRQEDPQIEGAVVVIDIANDEVLAMVGSGDFSDSNRQGQVNHALAKRQPGSTLKPFTYFLAFLHQKGPADLVLDAPYHFYLGNEKSYSPNNYDRRFHGVMPIREALANSLNIPAVLTLEEMGTSYYLELLHRFGFLSLNQAPSHYGLALTLGSGAVNLLELTNAYAALARGGRYHPAQLEVSSETQKLPQESSDVSPASEAAAFLVTHILSDPEARRRSFGDAALMQLDGRSVAVKTGTSHGSRDAWAIGYTPRFAVGVWMGHSDNSPMPGLSGAEAAIPTWHQVMDGLTRGQTHEAFRAPAGLVQQGFCRDPSCEVVKLDYSQRAALDAPQVKQPHESFRLITPVDGDHFLLDPRMPQARQQVFCEARLPPEIKETAQALALPVQWYVDGIPVATSAWNEPKTFLKLSPGQHQLRAMVGESKTRVARLTVSTVE